ncbi:hypothetical protein FKP32DRAFT_1671140 [Trametes sanguinea]|nr:hypothetical protein FKP32DRAFT_1671140 [Trametes sanguinea]
MSSHPRPVQRRTHQAKRKFALFTRAQAAPTLAPAPAPSAAPQFQWHEFKLLSLAEAQKREEIVYPSSDLDDNPPRAAEDQDGLSWPDWERVLADHLSSYIIVLPLLPQSLAAAKKLQNKNNQLPYKT